MLQLLPSCFGTLGWYCSLSQQPALKQQLCPFITVETGPRHDGQRVICTNMLTISEVHHSRLLNSNFDLHTLSCVCS